VLKPQPPSGSDDRSNRAPARKAYTAPRLLVYGDLAEITKAIVGTKTADGAGHPNKHFTS
jgi:hypothetical protein